MSKVLIIRLSAFGDVAMLVPVVQSVAAHYPQTRFSVLTRSAFAPLFNNLGFNINAIPVDLDGRHKGIKFFRTFKYITRQGFTHVIDEHDVLRTKLIRLRMMLTGKKVVHIDKGRKEKKIAIETKIVNPPLKSMIDRYLETFEKAGFPAEISFNNFFDFSNNDFYQLRNIAQEKVGRWIGIAPFAKHKGKIYPLSKMEKVVDILASDRNNRIFLFAGTREERSILKRWIDKYENVNSYHKELNLLGELLLISYLDVMISMDSANMHLASLVQVPVVSIWGATHPNLGFYGFRQDPENAIQLDLSCRPCSVYGNLPCERGDYACLTGISEEVIVDKVKEVLAKRPLVEIRKEDIVTPMQKTDEKEDIFSDSDSEVIKKAMREMKRK